MKRLNLVGGFLLFALVSVVCVVFFGRNGEYAVPFTVPGPRTEIVDGALRVRISGGVIRESPGMGPVVIWATRPDCAVQAEGISPERPVLLKNLLPLRAYEPLSRNVEQGGKMDLFIRESGEYVFTPRPPATYSFLLMGDPRGFYGRLEAALHDGGAALFAVCLGDLVSDGDPDQFDSIAAIAENSPLPVYFTVGNHDLEKGGRRHYRRLFGWESYDFVVGDDLFAVLDTAADYPYLGDNRLDWLSRTLERNGARHRFVLVHTPPVDPRPGENHRLRYPPLRRALRKIFRETGVEAVFASHIHDYAEGFDGPVPYVVTGGLGADFETARYPPHVVEVSVGPQAVLWHRKVILSGVAAEGNLTGIGRARIL